MATTWILDPTHSEVQFKVKHLMITNVTGSFGVVKATVESDDEQFSYAKVSFTADTASVNTGSKDRDTHLKSPEFFDTEKYPEITFEATDFNAGDSKIEGTLTIKGVSNRVKLDVEFNGINKDPWGNEKAGFSLSGKINRKDWGLNWNATLETGGVLVSDDVKVNAEVQFVKQA